MKTSDTSKKSDYSFRQWVSLPALPAVGLALVAYRILGKKGAYRWGNLEVTPLEPITRGEYLFIRLFPAGVIILGLIVVMMLTSSS